MVARIRNPNCMPSLATEGIYIQPLVPDKITQKLAAWREGLKPFERMHVHQTLASARRFAHFKPFSGLIPKHELDYLLSSSYNHSEEIFPEPIDVLLQPETIGAPSWRQLSNTVDLKLECSLAEVQIPLPQGIAEAPSFVGLSKRHKRRKTVPYRYNFVHPVIIGGLTTKVHPSYLKLMNKSHHTSQTNAGYSRQFLDGNVYQY